jgi:hypothetical protein
LSFSESRDILPHFDTKNEDGKKALNVTNNPFFFLFADNFILLFHIGIPFFREFICFEIGENKTKKTCFFDENVLL